MRGGSVGTVGRYEGRVVNEGGRPVPGAAVAVEWGTAATPEIGIVADAEGRFQVVLPDGRFRLGAHDQAGRSGVAEVTTPAPVPDHIVIVIR